MAKLSQDDGQICGHETRARFSFSVKNLPTFAHAFDRAVSFAYEHGLIDAAYGYAAMNAIKESPEE